MKSEKSGRRWYHWPGYVVLVLVGIEALVLVSSMAENSRWRRQNPDSTAFIRRYEWQSGDKVVLQWRNLGQISDELKRAVLISEDDAFFEHEGVDFKELEASWETDLQKHRAARGGSTITMQLVKNLYFSKSKNPLRKLNEILLSLDIERRLGKDRILEIYLNVVEWGPGVYGAENAGRYYFHKEAADLDASEAAYLAAILPNPNYFTTRGSRRAQRRKARILFRMSRSSLPPELR